MPIAYSDFDEDDFNSYGTPIAVTFDYGLLNEFLMEWYVKKNELKTGVITPEEYFEWKINWPYTCDDMGRRIPAKDWRKSKSDTENTTNG